MKTVHSYKLFGVVASSMIAASSRQYLESVGSFPFSHTNMLENKWFNEGHSILIMKAW